MDCKKWIITAAILWCSIGYNQAIAQQRTYFISVQGNDSNAGTKAKPFKTLQKAYTVIRELKGKQPVSILMLPGKYYLSQPLRLHVLSFPLTIAADAPGKVTLSGAKKMSLQWTLGKNGIYYTRYKGKPVDQLYVNGHLYHQARYPNYDSTKRIFNGAAGDVLAAGRIKKWNNPAGGYIHALHSGEWGGMHYKITGKKPNGELELDGGWQNNRPSAMHQTERFVENIQEELDVPGEWFYRDKKMPDGSVEAEIYCIPAKGDHLMNKALIELTTLDELIEIKGTPKQPVKNIKITGIKFTQTNRTFMQTKDPLLRSDWTIYRGGAVLLSYAEDCSINDCNFENLGGNAIFVSNYNRNHQINGNLIRNIGASGICFVGNPDAVRSPLFRYEQSLTYELLDKTAGSKTNDYPAQCIAKDNLIDHIGTVEKQTAGVQISMASEIIVSHNTIYNTPRAGINISEGTWGGHIIEFNEVFNTVLETGDHGAFNSWGRDRYWNPNRNYMDSIAAAHPELILLDAQKTTIIRNNIFRCDHGWDIDLDDGSSNYHIYNNICLNGGLKLREGFYRTVENNILINNTFHPHVWFKNSGDTFKHNIVSLPYAPIGISNAPVTIDSNFFLTPKGLEKAKAMGTDAHSIYGDADFKNANIGDYQVTANSTAFKVGFQNFDRNIGVQSPRLKKITQKAPISSMLINKQTSEPNKTYTWLDAKLKNIVGLGERSAAGLPDEDGVLLLDAGKGVAARSGLKAGDVIRGVDGEKIKEVTDMFQAIKKNEWKRTVKLLVFRNQQELEIPVQIIQ